MDMTDTFDPNGIALNNGAFLGLPYSPEESDVVILCAPWDVTVSYREGTRFGPDQVMKASAQLDLTSPLSSDAWKLKVAKVSYNPETMIFGEKLREKACTLIEFYSNGGDLAASPKMQAILDEVNHGNARFHSLIQEEASQWLARGKKVVLLGGDHSTPYGMMAACAANLGKGESFDVLHIDAHADLRNAYEGFTHSHASIMFNALKDFPISNLVQVGIRDLCPEEKQLIESDDRIHCFYDWDLSAAQLRGTPWSEQVKNILSKLGKNVYLSFDIDGLDPQFCPNTGTPVPGGLSYAQWYFLFSELLKSGKKLIGADLVEVSNGSRDGESEWDANVGARILFQLCLGISMNG